jgi:hypothetical protein
MQDKIAQIEQLITELKLQLLFSEKNNDLTGYGQGALHVIQLIEKIINK